MPPTRRKPFHLRLWHRRIGLTAAVFALLLSITGVLVNHTEALSLDSKYVKSGLLLDWYGIKAPISPRSFKAGGHWVSQLGERLYFDGHELTERLETDGDLVGAVELTDGIAVASGGHLILLGLTGELIEIMGGAEGVPAGMRAIGLSEEGRLVVRASQGDYFADEDLSRWEERQEGEKFAKADALWSRPSALPENLYHRMADAYRGKVISVERLLLDLHSGRIGGFVGVLVIDFMAFLIVLLTLSGVWIWMRHARREIHK